MYLSVRSVCASRMVSSDSLVSQARDVWIKPPLTIRDMRFFSDLGSRIISLRAALIGNDDRRRRLGWRRSRFRLRNRLGFRDRNRLRIGIRQRLGIGRRRLDAPDSRVGGGAGRISTPATSIDRNARTGRSAGFAFGRKKPNSLRKKLESIDRPTRQPAPHRRGRADGRLSSAARCVIAATPKPTNQA